MLMILKWIDLIRRIIVARFGLFDGLPTKKSAKCGKVRVRVGFLLVQCQIVCITVFTGEAHLPWFAF
jgi:hypothetical protein